MDELREAVKAWCREEGLTAWDRASQTGLLRNLVVREGRRTGQLQARIVTSPGSDFRVDELAAATPADSFLWTRAEGVAETTREGETKIVRGAAEARGGARGLRFRISPDAFFQTNTEMAERLYGAAAELAGLTGREKVLDLFCGIGTIALVLALDAGGGLGRRDRRGGGGRRDRERQAERRGQRPLLRGRRAARDARRCSSSRAARTWWWWTRRAPACRRRSCAGCIEAEAQRIVYVSCNPTTLAPERPPARGRGGYELRTVRPVDMFPQTPHIECVALLERSS